MDDKGEALFSAIGEGKGELDGMLGAAAATDDPSSSSWVSLRSWSSTSCGGFRFAASFDFLAENYIS